MKVKPILKLYFTDFWNVWNFEDNYFTNILRKDYEVLITPNDPDIIIYSWEGKDFLNYNCIRIYYTPENWLMPKYKECDFSLSFEYWDDSRNLRMPNYLLYDIHPDKLDKRNLDVDKAIATKTGFCSMVVSNPNTEIRNNFFHKLSRYKQIDSGGKHLNNIGGRVEDKYKFIASYKFNLCFENAQHPGYTTEKLPEAMSCNTVPIYWGNPFIGFEFNTKSFFNYADYFSEGDMIEDIIACDKDEAKYYNKFIEPWFENNIPNQYFDEQRVRKFLMDIIGKKDSYQPIAQNMFKKNIYYPLGYKINMVKGFIKKIVK
jgi:alpha(1,3/1,4) fucosyltransferase